MSDRNALGPDDPPAVGEYRLLARLATGSSGVAYLGQLPSGRLSTIRVLHPAWIAACGGRLRLARDLLAVRQGPRSGIVRVVSSHLGGKVPYIVSEFVEGPTLRAAVRARGPLEARALHQLAIASSTALVSLHGSGFVHGDLGPDSVVLGPEGPRVVNIDVARPERSPGPDPDIDARPRARPGAGQRTSPDRAQDVFAWAVMMIFASGGDAAPDPRTPQRPGDTMNRAGQTGGLPEPLGSVVRHALADVVNRPAAEWVLRALSTGPGAPSPPSTGASSAPDPAAATGWPARPGDPALGTRGQDPITEPLDPIRTPESWPLPHVPAGWPSSAAGLSPAGEDPANVGFADGDPVGAGPGRPHGRRGRHPGRVLALLLIAVTGFVGAAHMAGWDLRAKLREAADALGATVAAIRAPAVGGASIPSAPSRSSTLVVPASTTDPIPSSSLAEMTGRWRGMLTRSDSPAALLVRLSLQNRNGGQFESPEIGCTGVLTAQEFHADRAVYRYRRVGDPQGHCARSGTVTISRVHARSLRLRWVDNAPPYDSATGVLQRE